MGKRLKGLDFRKVLLKRTLDYWDFRRKNVVNERDDLRRRVRAIMGKNCLWVEPNVKSTVGAGIPDCKFKIGKDEIPVELKCWQRTKKGLKCEMRPAQIRYHVMGARQGKKSAILFCEQIAGSTGEFMMYLVANHNCPQEPYALRKKDAWLVGTSSDWDDSTRVRIDKILNDKEFWS